MELAYKSINCGEITEDFIGKNIKIAGWASTIRDLGGIIFVEIRDRSGLFQVVADPKINPQVHGIFQSLKSEDVVEINGVVSKRPDDTINDKLKTGRVEMYPEAIRLINVLKNVLPIPSDYIPADALIREFIGGSGFYDI